MIEITEIIKENGEQIEECKICEKRKLQRKTRVCYQACQEFLDALGKSTTFVSRASQKISFCTLLLFCDKMFT